MNPMLATPISQRRLIELCHDDAWVASPKIDGRRVLAVVEDGAVTVYARSGEKTTLPHRTLVKTIGGSLPKGRWVLDGELVRAGEGVNHVFWFDLIEAGAVITPDSPFRDRLVALETLGAKAWDRCVVMSNLTYAKTTEEKLRLVQRVFTANGEGVVLRRLDAPYAYRKRHDERSPDMVKFKFIRTVDCVVVDKGRGGKDNLVLAVYRGGERVEVGEVTALAGNGRFAEVGMVVEVRYMGLSEGGRLLQPTKPLIRVDKKPEECTWEQLVPLVSVVE